MKTVIEMAAEIKAQQEQEPVAKYIGECSEGSLVHLYDDVKKGTNFYTTPPQPAQGPRDIAVLVQDMAVSVDVSTGDHDQGHRLFGTVTLVQQNQGSRHGLILLVQDPQPNFKAQRKPWVGLTDEEIQVIAKKARSKDHAVTLTGRLLKEKNT